MTQCVLMWFVHSLSIFLGDLLFVMPSISPNSFHICWIDSYDQAASNGAASRPRNHIAPSFPSFQPWKSIVKGSQGTIRSLQRSWTKEIECESKCSQWKMLERRWSQWRMDYQQKSESRPSSPSFKFQALIVNTELSSPPWGPSFNLPENQPRSHFWPVVDRLGMLLFARRRMEIPTSPPFQAAHRRVAMIQSWCLIFSDCHSPCPPIQGLHNLANIQPATAWNR